MKIRVSSAQSEVRASISTALAEALICGIGECRETEMPLTELQQIHMAKMSIMAYDNAAKAASNLVVESQFRAE